MTYTHQKRPYRATCIQFNGSNFEQVAAAIKGGECTLSGYRDYYQCATEPPKPCIIVRLPGTIKTLYQGDWVVIGENGAVKIYSDETFRIKYEALESCDTC